MSVLAAAIRCRRERDPTDLIREMRFPAIYLAGATR